MGWLFSESWPTASAMRDHLREQLVESGYTIAKDGLVAYGHRYYAAVTNAEGKTTIFVALLNGDRNHGWGYKDMSEAMGPVEVDCPLSVLNAASPLEDLYQGFSLEWATAWRAKVRGYWAAKTAGRALAASAKPGDKVWVRNAANNPFTISNAAGGKSKLYGYDANGGGLYRLPMSRIDKVESGSAVGSYSL